MYIQHLTLTSLLKALECNQGLVVLSPLSFLEKVLLKFQRWFDLMQFVDFSPFLTFCLSLFYSVFCCVASASIVKGYYSRANFAHGCS